VLATAAAILFVLRRKRQHRQKQLPAVLTAGKAVDAECRWDTDADYQQQQQQQQQRQQLRRPGRLSDSARDVSHGNSSSHTSSSERVKLSGAVLAATLRDCCPGSSADIAADADAATAGSVALHSAAAAAAAGAGSQNSTKFASRSSNATEKTLGRRLGTSKSNSSANMRRSNRDNSTAAAAAGSGSSTVVVELGEQLGQLAELHRRQMSMSDCEVQDEVDQFRVNSFSLKSSHLRQQQQQGALLLLPGQQQGSFTISRISHAITSVSADMQMRRLAGGANAATAAAAAAAASCAVPGSRPVTAAAGSAGLFSGTARSSPASKGSGLAKSNTKSNTNNSSSGPLAGSKEAAAAAERPLVQTAAAVPPAWPLPESQPGEGTGQFQSFDYYYTIILLVLKPHPVSAQQSLRHFSQRQHFFPTTPQHSPHTVVTFVAILLLTQCCC
jgi:hypothetical protein